MDPSRLGGIGRARARLALFTQKADAACRKTVSTGWQKFLSGSACCHSCVGRNPSPGAALDSQSSGE